MKLICLNLWGGKIYEPLMDFIKKHSKDTDVFCFQEVFKTTSNILESAGFRLNLYKEIAKILSHHQGYFAPSVDNYITGSFQPNFVDFNLSWGLAIFINKQSFSSNKNLKVISSRDFFVYRKRGSFNPKDLNTIPRNAQYITFTKNGKEFSVCNLHGIWLKEGKKDSSSRISQSIQINDFLDKQKGEKILCGDLNLSINTKSLEILEKNLRNLIREYHISTTRSIYFPGKDEKYADYIFVSNGINVEDFQVPNLNISDHLPMLLEFS